MRFPFHRRVLERCEIAVGDRKAAGVPLFDGGFTGTQGVTGILSAADRTGRTTADAIAVTGFTPFAGHPSNNPLEAARRAPGLAAIVAVARGEGVAPGLALLNADAYPAPWGPPVLQVATSHQEWLNGAAARSAEAHFWAHVRLETTTAVNVQATIPGTVAHLAPLVIMTPRSGWWQCTSERGGGIAAWLACARHFATCAPARTVLLTANTGHELGHLGLDAYLGTTPQLIRDAHAWLHLGANFAAAGARLRLQASNAELLAALRRALEAGEIVPDATTPAGERPLGEARNIHDGGGNYVSLLASNPLFHHPDDRWPEAVDLDRATRITAAIVRLADRLANA